MIMDSELSSVEIWKQCEENAFYEVSSLGNVRSIARPDSHGGIIRRVKQISPSPDKDGYSRFSMNVNGAHKIRKIHRLVAKAFIPNPENKPQVNHKNFNKADNRIENLEWATSSENNTHVCDAGRKVPTGKLRLTPDAVRDIRDRLARKESVRQMAKDYGVSIPAIYHVKYGHCWMHFEPSKQVEMLSAIEL